MGEKLDKHDVMFSRDEKGELLPVEIELKIRGNPTIKVTPISRGEWLRIIDMEKVEQDKYLLLNHVIEPKFDEKDYEFIKPTMMGAIVTAITALTLDIDPERIDLTKKDELTENQELLLKKK